MEDGNGLVRRSRLWWEQLLQVATVSAARQPERAANIGLSADNSQTCILLLLHRSYHSCRVTLWATTHQQFTPPGGLELSLFPKWYPGA